MQCIFLVGNGALEKYRPVELRPRCTAAESMPRIERIRPDLPVTVSNTRCHTWEKFILSLLERTPSKRQEK